MILVDSSVWIDGFRKRQTAQTEKLYALLGRLELCTGDLILTEVLQGADTERDFVTAQKIMRELPVIEIASEEIALQAARNYRYLRAKGITIRKTIDTLIATRCIVDDHTLLFSDRDFEPFVTHLGLRSAMAEA